MESDKDILLSALQQCNENTINLVKIKKSKKKKGSRKPSRVDLLARPSIRRLKNVWEDSPSNLSVTHRNKIKSILEEDQFTSPKRTEEYFRQAALVNASQPRRASDGRSAASQAPLSRSQWLTQFSAQVARKLCTWVAERKEEISAEGDSNSNITELADVVLTRVADILGEAKPKRSDPSRLARFMVVVSDRIAVWIDKTIVLETSNADSKN